MFFVFFCRLPLFGVLAAKMWAALGVCACHIQHALFKWNDAYFLISLTHCSMIPKASSLASMKMRESCTQGGRLLCLLHVSCHVFCPSSLTSYFFFPLVSVFPIPPPPNIASLLLHFYAHSLFWSAQSWGWIRAVRTSASQFWRCGFESRNDTNLVLF